MASLGLVHVFLMVMIIGVQDCAAQKSCKRVGMGCKHGNDCCSRTCGPGWRVGDPNACGCNHVPGHCVSDTDCCVNSLLGNISCLSSRCAFVPSLGNIPLCKPEGAECNPDFEYDCCSGLCSAGNTPSPSRCVVKGACKSEGAECNPGVEDDCCYGHCSAGNTGPGRCTTVERPCKPLGAVCDRYSGNKECCSRHCIAGKRKTDPFTCACNGLDGHCATDTDCCLTGPLGPIKISAPDILTCLHSRCAIVDQSDLCKRQGAVCDRHGDEGECCSRVCGVGATNSDLGFCTGHIPGCSPSDDDCEVYHGDDDDYYDTNQDVIDLNANLNLNHD